MRKYIKQSHVVYNCDYHIVFVPKYRLTGDIGVLIEKIYTNVRGMVGCERIELNVQTDHVHAVVSIPPKVSVSRYLEKDKRENCNKDV